MTSFLTVIEKKKKNSQKGAIFSFKEINPVPTETGVCSTEETRAFPKECPPMSERAKFQALKCDQAPPDIRQCMCYRVLKNVQCHFPHAAFQDLSVNYK